MTHFDTNTRPMAYPLMAGLILAAACLSTATAKADDWPRWGGPNGDFKASTGKLATDWGDSGPKQLWARDLGDGYSSIVSDGQVLYTMYWEPDKTAETPKPEDAAQEEGEQGPSKKGKEVVIALDAKTGKTLWEYKYEADWRGNMEAGFGPGPNSTPLIVGDRLFTVGATVRFTCLDRKTGKMIWEHDLVKEYEASTMRYGYGVSPCAYKDTVILTIGGEKHSVVAFKQKDGTVAWEAQDFAPAYGTPQIISVDGETQLFVFMGRNLAGLNPDNGELIWKHEHKGSNMSTPIFGEDNIVFVSSSYGVGSRGIQLTRKDGKTTTEELWFNPKMKVMHGNAIRVGDTIYASSNEFGSPAIMAAINVKTGEFVWRKRGFSKATCLWADSKLILLDEDGYLALAQPTDDSLKVLCRHQICKRNAWTVPMMLGDTLFVRDRHQIMALDLSEKANKPTKK